MVQYKSGAQIPRGVLSGKFPEHPLKGTRILFYGRVPNIFPPLRGTANYTGLLKRIKHLLSLGPLDARVALYKALIRTLFNFADTI